MNIFAEQKAVVADILIDERAIGRNHPPYIIAELSANHNGSLDRALRLIEIAHAAGADAIKLQTYRADTITLDSDAPDFQIHEGLWAGQTLFELYQGASMPWEWHEPLFRKARSLGLTIFSSPFDRTAVDLLEKLDVPAYKIASFEAIDLPLIRYVASKGKPMILSTGMANAEEIAEAVAMARSSGCTQIALLHCISGYPAPASDYNLRTMLDMRERFGTVVGLSDHTIDNATAIAATALGASIIEKHFTLNRNDGGPDDSFSLQPEDLQSLCRDTRAAWMALGSVDYGLQSSERSNIRFRRSLYFVKDLEAGATITAEAVKSIRPGFGLAPKHLDRVIGSTLACAVRRGTPVRANDLLGWTE